MTAVKIGIESARRAKATRSLRKACIEALEHRTMLSVNVLTGHNDTTGDGANTSEIQLTPTNVKTGSFGKLFATSLDGQVYAQPLVDTGVTVEGVVQNVVFVATENDSLYAINSGNGEVLWKRSFLTLSDSNGILNNTMGATSISVVLSTDVFNCNDISPELGITGTPVIDSARNLIYLVTFTKEVVGGNTYFVQRLHAINIADGTDACTPYLIGTTTGSNDNTNNTPIYVYGDGDGYVTDPYNGTGKDVVQFNALTENQRPALSLVNNTVYVAWASHGDNGPYHGWIVTWNVSNVTTSGFVLSGVLNTSPNDGLSGVWQGGGGLVFEPNDSAFYFLTGNGTGEAPTLGSNGLPVNANYNESLVKAEVDTTTSPTNQNPNGWGLKIVDFFMPYNVAALDGADSDFGSGAPVLLPNPITINGTPTYVIVVGGKDGRLFVLNRNNLGHYNSTTDAALNAVPNGSGDVTAPVEDTGTLSQPAFYNGNLYVVSGYSGDAYQYSVSATGALTTVSQTSINFGYEPGGPSVSANGTANGIVWIEDRNTNELHAYNASSLNQELWNSSQASGGTDDPGAIMKFGVPTIANGEVFVATTNSLVAYGLTPAASSAPVAPVLAATALSGSAVNLTWTDASVTPNLATAYLVQESTDDVNFTQVTTAPAGATSVGIGGLNSSTQYYFRIQGINGVGSSSYSNVATATTTSQSSSINFASGFASAASSLTLNGYAAINGSNLELTNGIDYEASSAFSNAVVPISQFTSSFTFQISAGTNTAQGLTFTIQNVSPTALGANSGGLGYQGITNSVAIKFDLYNSAGEGSDSTGLFTGGAAPTNPGSTDLTSTGINLHGGDPIKANLTYNGTVLTVVLTDTVTNATATQTYTVNLPSVIGSPTAYVGFTGATGGAAAVQNIQNWTFTPGSGSTPNAPTGLGATPTTATSITLNWTNNALNQTGYQLDRATDAGFTQNLITETLPATPSSFTDTATGLATGGTYYYRIRAFNSVGDSSNSNVASVTIPQSPAKATNQQVTGVTSTQINLSWQDNAGHSALGYHVLRAANNGSFTLVATLPPTSRTAPSTYTWTDTNLTPGTFYEYHIQAYNTSGYNDFAGANATTITLAPTGLTASQGSNGVNLSWSPVTAFGGVTYNIYRGTTSGGEATTPVATGITTTSYLDPVPPGQYYYYEVTAVNANVSDTPPLPAESAFSVQASTAPSQSLTGTPIGTSGSYDGVSTIAKVFDGNLATFFDAPTAGTAASPNWVGLDLGATSNDTVTSINYAPRVGYETRMVGGQFQESNDPTFTTGVVTLATISSTPVDGFTTISVSGQPGYRYIRYLAPAGAYGNIAEMQLTGTTATVSTTGPSVTTPPAATVSAAGITAALSVAASETGNPALTYTWSTVMPLPAGADEGPQFSSANGTTSGNALTATFSAAGTYTLQVIITDPSNNSIVVPLTVNVNQVLTSTTITPTATPVSVPAGGTVDFTAAGNDQFGNDMNTEPTFTWSVASGVGSINASTGVYTASTTVGSTAVVTATASGSAGTVVGSADIKTITATQTSVALTGTPIGTSGSYDGVSTIAKVFDGNLATFFDAATGGAAGSLNWAGLDLGAGSNDTVTSITYAPRVGYETRMVGGIFQESNDPTFTTGVVTLATISATPVDGYTTIPVTGLAGYRYVRYLAPAGSYGNIAEMQLSGVVGTAAPSSGTLSGTPIGTAGSYDGVSTIAKVFDGNLATYFDAAAAGTAASPNWVGLDLGSTYSITSITYAPRVGYESRMIGGYFQASNDPTFTTGDVTLGTTITAAPADGYNTIANTTTGAYRYVRYVSPAGGYGNIAELQFAGTAASSSGTAPTVTTPPAATLSASGTSAALTVAASETGNPALTYTWSVSSLPTGVTAVPTFSSTNGTTAGNAATITFPAAGTYGLSVKITDPSSNSTTATLPVTVTQVLTSISITPASTVSVVAGGTQAFSATALDQFGIALATQPTFTWSLANGSAGSINASGLYTASATVGSTATVTATSSAVSGASSVTTVASKNAVALSGTPIGTPGSYDGVSTIAKAFDGNLATYFDAPTGGTTGNLNWVGLDLGAGSNDTVTSITYAPRVGYETRTVGGVFQESNDPTFTTGVVTLATITATPVDGYTTIPVSGLAGYRYVRYLAPPSSYGNIAELQFNGVASSGTNPSTPGTPTLTYATSTTAQISWTASTDSAGITQYSIYRNNVLLGTSATPTYTDYTLVSGTTYSYTVVATDAAGNKSAASSPLTLTAPASITGTPIGTSGSYDGVSTIAKVFDGNVSTYFDAPTAGTASSPNWVGLDLGSGTPDTITAISFAPRVGFESRMVGGVFQESNDPTFTTGVVTLGTITTTPLDGLTTIAVPGQTGYRYIRYLAPAGSYGNIAEMQLFGTT